MFTSLLGNIIIGLIVAVCVTGVLKKQLTSVAFQKSASFYVNGNSLKITKSQELFLGSHIMRHTVSNNQGGGRGGGGRGGPGGRGGGGRGGRR